MPFWINILVGLLAFVIAALGGKALLPWLHKLKFGQPIIPLQREIKIYTK